MEFPGEKLVLKMWETIAEKGIGSALKPWHEKRLGLAKNEVRKDEILMLAEAEKLAEDIRSGKVNLVEKRLEYKAEGKERIEPILNIEQLSKIVTDNNVAESIRKDVNVSKAVIVAEKVLLDEQQPASDDKVDDDWLHTWRENAGKISTSELQDLWGRILAGEVKNPGSYSIRTMEFLKGLSIDEAELISKLAKYVIAGSIVRDKDKFLEAEGIPFGVLLFLQEIGIVSGVEALGLSIEFKTDVPDKYLKPLISNNKALIIEHDDPTKILKLGIYQLTHIGKQILALASFTSNEEYLNSVGQDIAKQGYTVQFGDWMQLTKDQGRLLNSKKIEA
jgi:hypothetical protein